jgi:hypothetical protein
MDMEDAVAGLMTKSDKIRALDRAGYTRSQIAGFLKIRYQHVRNVLVDEQRKSGALAPQPSGMADPGRPFVRNDEVDVRRAVRIQVAKNGAMTLPPALLAVVGLWKGGVLLARFDDDEIKLMTPEATTRKIQSEMRKFVPEGVSLVDELIQERRREVEREQGDA